MKISRAGFRAAEALNNLRQSIQDALVATAAAEAASLDAAEGSRWREHWERVQEVQKVMNTPLSFD